MKPLVISVKPPKSSSKHFLKSTLYYKSREIFFAKSLNQGFSKFDWLLLAGSQSDFGSSDVPRNTWLEELI